MRIYKNKYYLMADTPGISGFKRWNEKEYYVSTGHRAKNNRTRVLKEYRPDLFASWFRIEDGHLPDYQPRLCEEDALKWLDKNMFQRIIFILDTEKHYI